MKRQNITPIVIAAISLFLVNLTFAAPPRYEIIDLGTLGGGRSGASSINNSGQIVGYAYNSSGYTRAVSFDPTVKSNITNLGTLGVRYSDARAINNVGQVAGWSDTVEGLSSHAYLWDPINGMVDLGALPGMECSCASALNDFGVVVGSSGHCDDDNAFIWDCINGMHYLEKGPSGDNAPTGINNAGQVVGWVWRSDIHGTSAFLWDSDSGVVELGTLGGRASCAIAINNAGQVVGWADTPSMAEHAFIWDSINGMRDLGTLGGSISMASGINNHGQVVGRSQYEPDNDNYNAFLWDSSSGMIDLGPGYACAINDARQIVGFGSRSAPGFYGPAFYWDIVNGKISLIDLLPPGSGWQELIRALDINNRGQIVGIGITDAGQYHAFLMTPVPPKVIYVDNDATGANDGSSWADAFKYLQDALAAAWSGDEIRVAQGLDKPDQGAGITPGDREATFQLISGVTLKGGYAGFGTPDPNTRDIELFKTILSGDIGRLGDCWDNSYHVVTGSGTDATAVLDGFTVTGGNAYGSNWRYRSGGGMYILSGSPQVTNCTFTANLAYHGGGGMYNDNSSPTLTFCSFVGNIGYWGGGMYNQGGNSMLSHCTFSENYADQDGGGMYNDDHDSTLTNCSFSGNTSFWNGGGMFNGGGSPSLTHCIFTGNTGYWGGGIDNMYSNPTLSHCIFNGNVAERSGGGMSNTSDCNSTLTNCTFADNLAGKGNALACYTYTNEPPSNLQLTNCILWDGGDEIWNNSGSTINIAYSDVHSGWPGEGNTDVDPCFVKQGYWAVGDDDYFWVEGDYHLLPDSPCIDAGDPNYIAEPNETDLDGKPRIIGGRIDMGAYEYSPPVPAEARIVPRTINLASKGKSITCYIWLPEDYDVADIDPDSILLESAVQAASLSVDEEKQVATARFSREEVQDILSIGEVELKITGRLTDGTLFEGTDVIRVISRGGGKPAN